MRKLLMAAAAAGTLVATVPASAQIYLGADPDGAGVRLARSGSAWGRATAGAVTNITPTAPIAPWSGNASSHRTGV
jgi:hypothetical protein